MSGAAVKQKGCVRMNKFDTMSKDALSKMEELINASKLNELLHKKEEEDKKIVSSGCLLSSALLLL